MGRFAGCTSFRIKLLLSHRRLYQVCPRRPYRQGVVCTHIEHTHTHTLTCSSTGLIDHTDGLTVSYLVPFFPLSLFYKWHMLCRHECCVCCVFCFVFCFGNSSFKLLYALQSRDTCFSVTLPKGLFDF